MFGVGRDLSGLTVNCFYISASHLRKQFPRSCNSRIIKTDIIKTQISKTEKFSHKVSINLNS